MARSTLLFLTTTCNTRTSAEIFENVPASEDWEGSNEEESRVEVLKREGERGIGFFLHYLIEDSGVSISPQSEALQELGKSETYYYQFIVVLKKQVWGKFESFLDLKCRI